MPQKVSRFSDDELAAAVDAGEDLRAFAARFGVTKGLVTGRLRKLRIARGEPVRDRGDFSWDDKLRPDPSAARVERLYLTHGHEAVEEVWGRTISTLRKRPAKRVGPSRRESVA